MNPKKKRMFIISGLVGSVQGSNQSFKNTIEGYLKNDYKVYHFAFQVNQKNKNNLEKYNYYKYIGISKLFYFLINTLHAVKKIFKNNKSNISSNIIPEVNEIIQVDNDISMKHELFYKIYNLFEFIRVSLYSFFIKPDIVYAYEVYGVKVGKKISNRFKIPFIKRFQGTFLSKENLNNKKMRFMKEAYSIDSDLVVMANDGTKGDLILELTNNKNVLFIENGLDLNFRRDANEEYVDELKNKYNIKGKFILGIFNRAYPFKRIDRAIYLLRKSIDEGIDTVLLIGGMDGPCTESLIQYSKELQVYDKIIWLGRIPYHNMVEYYFMCNIILIVNDMANTGNQIFEVSFLGLPTIATDDGNNCKYFNNKNIHYVKASDFSTQSLIELKKIYENYENKNIIIKKDSSIITWEDRMKKEIKLVESLYKKKD